MRGFFLPQQTRANGQPASEQRAAIVELIAPVVISFAAILLTTLVLFMIDSYLATEPPVAGLSIAHNLHSNLFRQYHCGPDLVRKRARSCLLSIAAEV
jgi:hypothetical protein